jgi:hypothetical protein
MDPRDVAKGNGVTISVAPLYVNMVPGTNWGVPTASLVVVTLDPQVNARSSSLENAAESEVELVGRGVLRRRMTELANEFVVMHDDLLRELAR